MQVCGSRCHLRLLVFFPPVGQDSPSDRGQSEHREGHADRRAHGREHRGDCRAEGTRCPSHPRYCPPAPGLGGKTLRELVEFILGVNFILW